MNPYRTSDTLTTVNYGKLYWSRVPGKFVNKLTGDAQSLASSICIGPQFTGTTLEWYETLCETIIDASNHLKRTCGHFADVVITNNKDLMCILEPTLLYQPHAEKEYCGKLMHGLQVEYIGNGQLPSNTFELMTYDESANTKHTVLVEIIDMP